MRGGSPFPKCGRRTTCQTPEPSTEIGFVVEAVLLGHLPDAFAAAAEPQADAREYFLLPESAWRTTESLSETAIHLTDAQAAVSGFVGGAEREFSLVGQSKGQILHGGIGFDAELILYAKSAQMLADNGVRKGRRFEASGSGLCPQIRHPAESGFQRSDICAAKTDGEGEALLERRTVGEPQAVVEIDHFEVRGEIQDERRVGRDGQNCAPTEAVLLVKEATGTATGDDVDEVQVVVDLSGDDTFPRAGTGAGAREREFVLFEQIVHLLYPESGFLVEYY
jgi:hypothetical protein